VAAASELHLEVSCFAVRPAAASSTAQVTEEHSATAAEGDHTAVTTDQRCGVSIPSAVPATSVFIVQQQSDEEREAEPVNASVGGELAASLSRTATVTESQRSATEKATNSSVLGDCTGLLAGHESPVSQQPRSATLADAVSSTSSSRSLTGRGRRPAVAVRDRRQSLPPTDTDTQPSLTCTTADLLRYEYEYLIPVILILSLHSPVLLPTCSGMNMNTSYL